MPKSPSTLQFHCTQSTVHKHTRILWYNGPMGSVADHARITESSPSNHPLAIAKRCVRSFFIWFIIIRLFTLTIYISPHSIHFSHFQKPNNDIECVVRRGQVTNTTTRYLVVVSLITLLLLRHLFLFFWFLANIATSLARARRTQKSSFFRFKSFKKVINKPSSAYTRVI